MAVRVMSRRSISCTVIFQTATIAVIADYPPLSLDWQFLAGFCPIQTFPIADIHTI